MKQAIEIVMRALRKVIEKELQETHDSGEETMGFAIDFYKMSDEELIRWYLGER